MVPSPMIATIWPLTPRFSPCKLRRRSFTIACAPKSLHPAERLQKLLQDSPRTIPAPAIYDGLSARMVCQKGFSAAFISGFCVAATRYGEPDVGLMSFGENRDAIRDICTAVNRCALESGIDALPLIADAETGYGNEANVKKTYYALAELGVAGVLIEDQQSPKACGHVQGRQVVSRVEARARIRAAVEARDDLRRRFGAAPLIFARTDARQASSLDEALDRVKIFADEGVDVLFIDALTSVSEMRSFANVRRDIPHMTNMLEGGGKTPICEIWELSEMGFKIAAFPLSLLSVSVNAMEKALTYLKNGVVPDNRTLAPFSHLQDILGFDHYLQKPASEAESDDKTKSIEDRSSISEPSLSAEIRVDNGISTGRDDLSGRLEQQETTESAREGVDSSDTNTPASQKVEPSFIIPPNPQSESEPERKESSTIVVPSKSDTDDNSSKKQSIRMLRLKVTENGKTKVDLRAPAGIADKILAMVPSDILENAGLENLAAVQQSGSGLVLDVNDGDTRTEIWLE